MNDRGKTIKQNRDIQAVGRMSETPHKLDSQGRGSLATGFCAEDCPACAEARESAKEKERQDTESLEIAQFIIRDIWLPGYRAGRVTFEQLCRRAEAALKDCNQFDRRRALGALVDEGIRVTPKKRRRGNSGLPPEVRGAALNVMALVEEREGLKRSRVPALCSTHTAYTRTAEIMCSRGIVVTAAQVEKWARESGVANKKRKT